jgi:DNA-binding IclR family transcriptional regulator
MKADHNSTAPGGPKNPREGNERSLVARAFRTVELLAERPQTASAVAREFDIDRSTALRLLRELELTGYVARDAATKRYSTVGSRFYQLVLHTPDHSAISDVVDPILGSLRQEFGEATLLAVPSRGSMVYVGFFSSLHVLAVREQLGSFRPMHCSAVGKAYLSSLDERSLDDELGRLSYKGGTELAAKDATSLRQRIEVARVAGYAVDRDETSVGVSCIAAPLWIEGVLVGAIGVTGPTARLTEELVMRIGSRIREKLRQSRPFTRDGDQSLVASPKVTEPEVWRGRLSELEAPGLR